MNRALLIRNLFLLRRNYLKYLSMLLLLPMLLYLMNVLIISNYSDDARIEIWSSLGIWFSSCILCSYIYIYDIFSTLKVKDKKVDFIINSPISVFYILLSGS